MKSIYYQPGSIQFLVKEIKSPLGKRLRIIFDPKASIFRKLRAGIEFLGILGRVQELPEPTMDNVGSDPNARQLVRIRDYFFARAKNIPRLNAFRNIVNIVIVIYVTDFYKPFINVWWEELRKCDFVPNGPLQPDHHFWNKAGGE